MVVLMLFLLVIPGPAVATAQTVDSIPAWFIPLREAVYEQQLTANQIAPMYTRISATARSSSLGEAPLNVVLSRIEYMMGRAYQYEDRKSEAAARYTEGMRYAERAIEIQPSAAAWQMLGENLSQSCAVRPASFAMANGLNVEKYARNALALDSRNAAAQIMIASRWVYAPSPFNNHRRGIEMMSLIPAQSNMEKDDRFNVYVGIAYAYIQLKNFTEARPWLVRALEVYPTNKYARSLLDNI